MTFLLAVPPWWDVAWSTWALVFVGLGGTVAAAWTLRTIRRQTAAIESQVAEVKSTSRQTDRLIEEATRQSIAAKRSADAIINSERAWIHLELARESPLRANYTLRAVNLGRTPSQIISWQ